MKRTTLLIALTLTLTASVFADVLIYKDRATITVTGNGAIQRETVTGHTVIDAVTGDMTEIVVYPKRGKFRIRELSGYFIEPISGGPKKPFTIVGYFDDSPGEEYAAMLKGLNTTLKTAPAASTNYVFPKALTGTAQGRFSFAVTGATMAEEARLRSTWDKKATDAANAANQTLAQAVAALRTALESKGYSLE